MSVQPERRYGDVRMDKLEATVETMQGDIKTMQKDITYIKTRIDNGFENSIKSTENKVNYIDARNREEHKLLMGKMDKIIFLLVSGSISIVIGITVLLIKGLI